MRVVLDTNVIISGIFFSGPSYQIPVHPMNGYFSEPIGFLLIAEIAEAAKECLSHYLEKQASRKFDEYTTTFKNKG